jgi:radical SAM protein with 4Fe4S-binding SPASM domain
MSLEIARKIAADLIKEGFSGKINLGENGDAFLNPQFKEIVLEMGKTKAKLTLFTNMKHLTKEMSGFLLKNGLTELVFDVDGATKETYEAMKTGCNFEEITKNIHDFIDQRNSINPLCQIHILSVPIKRYLQFVEKVESKLPYDYAAIEKYWKKYLSPIDTMNEIVYLSSWSAKDYHSKIRTKPCAIWNSNTSCFIDTEGDVYPCCKDYKTQFSFGNVMNSSIREIWNGEKRKKFITDLVNNNFVAIGQPCVTCGERNDDLRSYLNYLKYRLFYRRLAH